MFSNARLTKPRTAICIRVIRAQLSPRIPMTTIPRVVLRYSTFGKKTRSRNVTTCTAPKRSHMPPKKKKKKKKKKTTKKPTHTHTHTQTNKKPTKQTTKKTTNKQTNTNKQHGEPRPLFPNSRLGSGRKRRKGRKKFLKSRLAYHTCTVQVPCTRPPLSTTDYIPEHAMGVYRVLWPLLPDSLISKCLEDTPKSHVRGLFVSST